MLTDSITENEELLIRKCLLGDEAAMEALYHKYYGKMFNVCLKYAGSKDEAKDILQEGFIRMFKYISQFSFEGSFEGWVRRIMVNTSINWMKKYINRRENFLPEYDSVTAEPGHPDFEDELVSNITAGEILAGIRQLPPVYRMVFNLHAVEGYSHKEISDMLEINESTSRSNLVKARRTLQKILIKKSTIGKNSKQ